MIRGYARVSTDEQEMGRQIVALEGAGCAVIYQDKISGATRAREGLDKMLAEMEAGDIVIVQKLDRLGRSMRDLVYLMEGFKDKGIGFKSLTEAIDTTTLQGVLLWQIMGALAEFERGLIRERIRDGMRFKMSQGVKMGRKVKDRGADLLGIGVLLDEGKSREEIISEMGISRHQYYQALKSSRKWNGGEVGRIAPPSTLVIE